VPGEMGLTPDGEGQSPELRAIVQQNATEEHSDH
jgi:hypothetical protein